MRARHPGPFERWLQSRLPLQDTQLLTQRNVYILPTRAGWLLALTLLVLLVTSINFELNLGYLLTFMLAGSVLAGMHVGHATLRGIALHLAPPEPAFAGRAAVLQVRLTSERKTPRYGIDVGVQGTNVRAWTDVRGGGATTVQISFVPPGRGVHRVPAIRAETRFPLGAFRAWTVWRPAAQVVVYPQPEAPPPPLPHGASRSGTAVSQTQSQGPGDIEGVRGYQRGDPMRMVVWKKAASAIARGSDDLVSRDTRTTRQQDLWLDVNATRLSDPEQRLSRLCAWVMQADRLGVVYGLQLAASTIAPSQGPAHQRRCLEALARC